MNFQMMYAFLLKNHKFGAVYELENLRNIFLEIWLKLKRLCEMKHRILEPE